MSQIIMVMKPGNVLEYQCSHIVVPKQSRDEKSSNKCNLANNVPANVGRLIQLHTQS